MFYFFLVLIFNDNGFFLLNLPPLRTSQVTMKPHSSLSHISSPLPKRRVILPLPFSAKESIRRLKKDRFEIHPFLFVNRWGFCTEEAHFWNIFLNLFMSFFFLAGMCNECALIGGDSLAFQIPRPIPLGGICGTLAAFFAHISGAHI